MKNEKIKAWFLPKRSESKTTCYMFDQSLLQPFDRKYHSATVLVLYNFIRWSECDDIVEKQWDHMEWSWKWYLRVLKPYFCFYYKVTSKTEKSLNISEVHPIGPMIAKLSPAILVLMLFFSKMWKKSYFFGPSFSSFGPLDDLKTQNFIIRFFLQYVLKIGIFCIDSEPGRISKSGKLTKQVHSVILNSIKISAVWEIIWTETPLMIADNFWIRLDQSWMSLRAQPGCWFSMKAHCSMLKL